MQYRINDKGNDKLVVIIDQIIYNINPSTKKISSYEKELRNGLVPKGVSGIPLN